MIQGIGVMIGLYIILRYCEMFKRNGLYMKIAIGIMIFCTIGIILTLMNTGTPELSPFPTGTTSKTTTGLTDKWPGESWKN